MVMNPAQVQARTAVRPVPDPVAPDRSTVELVLRAAADVIFSDGVSPAMMRDWVDETCFMLSLTAASADPSGRPRFASGSAGGPVYDARLPPE